MNGNERKTRAALQFMAWAEEFSPEWAAVIREQVGDAPKAGALNQLGEAWDMFYPSKYYGGTGYRGRWHTSAEHLGGLGQGDWWETSAPAPSGNDNGGDWADKLFNVAEKAISVLPTVFQARQTIAVADVNLERAKRGLPPLDPQATAAQINVTHQLPPDVTKGIQDMKLGGINILLIGALALGGFFVVRAMR